MINTIIRILRKWQNWLDKTWIVMFIIVDLWIACFITISMWNEIGKTWTG